MTATGSRSAVPTGAWGRPVRPRPAAGLVDLTEPGPVRPAGPGPGPRGRGFSPTPPPPAPPGSALPQAGRRAWPGGLGHRAVELAVAVVVLAGLAGMTGLARGPAPSPLTPQARWDVGAAPAVASLARDVASAGDEPVWSPAMARRLKADLHRVEAAGRPPDPATAAVWDRALRRVGAAISQAGADPAAARPELRTAGLELTELAPGGA